MTTSLVLFGTLRDPALRRIVLAAEVPVQDAVLPGWQVARVRGAVWPALIPGESCAVEVAEVTEAQRQRADFFEAVHGFAPQPSELGTVYRPQHEPDTDGPWSLSQWQAEGGWMREAAVEIMDRQSEQPEGLARFLGIIGSRAWSRQLAQAPAPVTRQVPRSAPEVLSRRPAHRGFFALDQARLRWPRFDGTQSDLLEREVFIGGDAALVLPYDAATDRVVLVEQVRMGPWRRGDGQLFTLEPVAGLIDAGETPETAARREAEEEAGLTLGALTPMAGVYPSPGDSTNFFHCFLGACALEDRDCWIGGKPEEGEDIRAHALPLTQAMAMIDSGEIRIAATVMMLLWLDRHLRG